MPPPAPPRTVALVTLGLRAQRGRLRGARRAARGRRLEPGRDPADADAVLVNTCGFVESAKKDSVDTLLAAADLKDGGRPQAVVAVGCLAERYGDQLAEALPEADAVLGFDDYAADRRPAALDPGRHARTCRTPRGTAACCFPLTPADRPAAGRVGRAPRPRRPPARYGPGLRAAHLPAPARGRADGAAEARVRLRPSLQLLRDPAFRGAFVSRRPADVLDEARWLAEQGVRELFLVSENSTSYGKDLGDLRLLETLLPELAGRRRHRAGSRVLPAACRDAADAWSRRWRARRASCRTSTCPSSTPLRRPCCGGCAGSGTRTPSSRCWTQARAIAPSAGARSNVIVGFPGETEEDLAELERFLTLARLDVVGVFGYSDEDGTEAAAFDGQAPRARGRGARRSRVTARSRSSPRSAPRSGSASRCASWSRRCDGDHVEGRADHQGPEVDGTTTLLGAAASPGSATSPRRGSSGRRASTWWPSVVGEAQA